STSRSSGGDSSHCRTAGSPPEASLSQRRVARLREGRLGARDFIREGLAREIPRPEREGRSSDFKLRASRIGCPLNQVRVPLRFPCLEIRVALSSKFSPNCLPPKRLDEVPSAEAILLVHPRRPRARQQELAFRSWGGPRRGAGRKRTGPRTSVSHRAREAL